MVYSLRVTAIFSLPHSCPSNPTGVIVADVVAFFGQLVNHSMVNVLLKANTKKAVAVTTPLHTTHQAPGAKTIGAGALNVAGFWGTLGGQVVLGLCPDQVYARLVGNTLKGVAVITR